MQSQTHFFEFDLSLTTMQFSPETNAAAHIQSHTRFFEFGLSLTKIQFSAKTNAAAHVQSQLQFFEFDLSLTKLQFSARTNAATPTALTQSLKAWDWRPLAYERSLFRNY